MEARNRERGISRSDLHHLKHFLVLGGTHPAFSVVRMRHQERQETNDHVASNRITREPDLP